MVFEKTFCFLGLLDHCKKKQAFLCPLLNRNFIRNPSNIIYRNIELKRKGQEHCLLLPLAFIPILNDYKLATISVDTELSVKIG